jgi:parallel beta-helix repeat protein
MISRHRPQMTFTIFMTLILACSSHSLVSATSVHEANSRLSLTIYVDANNTQGPWDGSMEHPFLRIQDGINHANDSDTVYVFPGLYTENVVANKSIVLMGADKNTTIIDADHTGSCITLISRNVHVSGFTVQHSGDTEDIEFHDSGILSPFGSSHFNHVISDNIIQENHDGVYYWGAQNITIINNIIQDNRRNGIDLDVGADYCTINHNCIINNGAEGIHVDDESSTLNRVIANYLDNNTNSGIVMEGYICNITMNHVSHSKNGIMVTGFYSRILSNTLVNNDLGLSMTGSLQAVVEANSFENNTKDATFIHYLLHRFMLPFIVWPQITKWHANYWGQPLSRPKVIQGRMVLSQIPSFPGIPWNNFDFAPATTPYPGLRICGGLP